MAGKIPLSSVYQSETIDRRILEVVKSGNYILGPECKAFEQELAAYFGVKHCRAQLIMDGRGPTAAHRAGTQSRRRNPRAVAHGVSEHRADDPRRRQAGFLRHRRHLHDRSGRCAPAHHQQTVGILPVHLYGRPANIDAFKKLADRARAVDHRRLCPVARREVEEASAPAASRQHAALASIRRRI